MAPADPPPTRTPHRRPAPTAPRTRTHPHPSRPPPEHPPGPDQRTRTRHTPRHHPHRSIPPMAQHPTTTDPHRLTPIGASQPRPSQSQEPHPHQALRASNPHGPHRTVPWKGPDDNAALLPVRSASRIWDRTSATPLSHCYAPPPSAAPPFLVQWRVEERSRAKGAQQTTRRGLMGPAGGSWPTRWRPRPTRQ